MNYIKEIHGSESLLFAKTQLIYVQAHISDEKGKIVE